MIFQVATKSILFISTYTLGAYLLCHSYFRDKSFSIRKQEFSFFKYIIDKLNSCLGSITSLVGLSRSQIYFELISKLIMLAVLILASSIIFPSVASLIYLIFPPAVLIYFVWVFKYRNRLVSRYREIFESEFTEFIEGLALAVNSGLPLVIGILRVIDERLMNTAKSTNLKSTKNLTGKILCAFKSPTELHNPLIREISLLRDLLNRGEPVAQALDNLALRLNSTTVANLSDVIYLSTARGTPIAVLINHHAESMRETQRKRLLERAGRAEVKMMVPVVFLLLPISVLFALWPSFQQLQHLVTIS